MKTTNYLEKAKRRTDRQREKLAVDSLCKIHEGSRKLFHYVKTGWRNRAVHLAHFQSFPCYIGAEKIRLSTYQFNQMFVDHGEAAIKLFELLLGKKANNKARTIANLAPICASYEFCPVH